VSLIRIVLSRHGSSDADPNAVPTVAYVGRVARIIGPTLSLDGKRVVTKWLAGGSNQWLDEHGAAWTHVDFEVLDG
jgi:hypothetical protein